MAGRRWRTDAGALVPRPYYQKHARSTESNQEVGEGQNNNAIDSAAAEEENPELPDVPDEPLYREGEAEVQQSHDDVLVIGRPVLPRVMVHPPTGGFVQEFNYEDSGMEDDSLDKSMRTHVGEASSAAGKHLLLSATGILLKDSLPLGAGILA
ncbi:hypothetical protein R1sor_015211 [Riccia sorocarpa]|uniref:Uncharacterized protein n=1 Tax=Riccia sorocarpa TaxID=122646 RepID=A0ABD3HEL7_9MARC